MKEQFADLVILGGGSGGYSCALRAAELGLSVILIEKDRLGGTCLHRGCIPTKALLHAADIADAARSGTHVGVRSRLDGIDMAGVHRYKDSVITKLHKGLQGLVKSRKVELVHGVGRFAGGRSVEVEGVRYTGKNVVLATGSYARTLPDLEIGEHIKTSDQVLESEQLPSRVVVLGGGVIGAEFASVWNSFGAEVTVVEASSRLLPSEDESSSRLLERAFRRRGIAVEVGVRFDHAVDKSDGVVVFLDSGEQLEADLLLVAVGRSPNTADQGFEEAGLRLDCGFVVTDERLCTNLDGVRAVGDIVPGLQLAHRGFQQGIFVAEDIAGLNPRPIDESGVPRVTYCEPEVASVGLTEVAAREKFGDVQTVTYDLAGNGKSQILGTTGAITLVKAGAKGTPGPVVGVHIVGSRAGELIGEAQLVYNWGAEAEDVAPLVHAHPTQNEALGEAMMALAGKALHAHV